MQETFTYDDTYSKPMFDRGFTGHEHLTAFGLINMNGRMYDPVMSSFLSADRYVQDPTSAQGFNRYAYCMYNPLRFVDPSGWLMGGGNGHQPDGPLPRVMINNQAHYVIPETTITASPAPFTANTFNNEFVFTPNPSSDGITQWYYWSNYGPSNGHNGGSGSSGNHGGKQTVPKVLGEIPPKGAKVHSAENLSSKAFWHYQFGKRKDYWIDASTIDLDFISQADLEYHDGIAIINLYDYIEAEEYAFVFGKIRLEPKGNNIFEIKPDEYDFNIEWNYGWNKRNIATAASGLLHGPVIDNTPLPTHWMGGRPCFAQPSVYWGGPFYFHFSNCIYIKP